MTVTFTRAGLECRYQTTATDIGTLTGSKTTGGTATIDLNASLPRHGGSFLCGGSTAQLTGSYKVGTPDYLDVDAGLGPVPTSPAGTTYTGKVHATSEGHVTIHNTITDIKCSSTLEGEVKTHGGGEPISIPLSSLTFTGCTDEWVPHVVTKGTLEVHAIAGSKNGTLTWTGATFTFTRAGLQCSYKTEVTDIGTLTGSKTTGGTATIDLSGALTFHGGSFLCVINEAIPSLTGSYKVGTPDYLDVDASIGPVPTSPAGTTYAGNLHASSEGHVVIHNAITNIECNSTLEGEVKPSDYGEPISFPLSSLTFTGCTNGWVADVTAKGSLEVHAIAGTNNGTVTSTGMTVTFTRFGLECRYQTTATDIGTLTGSKATGGTATIDLSAALPRHGGSFLCGGSTAQLTGSYKVPTPDYLDVDG
jgi:hypothetical protein